MELKWPDDFINKVICGDCLEVMKKIPDKSVNLVLTDPPYGTGCDKGVGGGIYRGRKYKDNWDIRPTKNYFDEILRVSNQVIIFGGNFFTDLLPVNGHWIVWDKTGEIKFNNPYSMCELAWTNIPKNTIKKYICIQAGFIAKEKERFHPTQKPVRVFRQIIEDYSVEGIILDPFLGSGTTAVACKELGRRFIGIEIDPKYCEIAERRLAQEVFKF
jgi:DNA modification methylase